jgi:hypothetical protein
MRLKISAHVDGGLSAGSRMRRPGSEDPHRKFSLLTCYNGGGNEV